MDNILRGASVFATTLFLFVNSAQASIYSINIQLPVNGVYSAGSLIGTIITDGTLGALAASNITDWNVVATAGANSIQLLGPLSGNNSVIVGSGTQGLAAVGTGLYFDFATAGDLFAIGPDSTDFNFCFDALYNCLGPTSLGLGVPDGHGGYTISLLSFSGTQLIATETPLPTALPLFATGLGALGLLGWRRRRKVKLEA